jgi:hypothetical protein
MLAAVATYFEAHAALANLSGYASDPGFADTAFTKVYLGTQPALEAHAVEALLVRGIAIVPAPPPSVSDSQRVHDERLRNDRAGDGYLTNRELERKRENPVTFAHGASGLITPKRAPTGDDDA